MEKYRQSRKIDSDGTMSDFCMLAKYDWNGDEITTTYATKQELEEIELTPGPPGPPGPAGEVPDDVVRTEGDYNIEGNIEFRGNVSFQGYDPTISGFRILNENDYQYIQDDIHNLQTDIANLDGRVSNLEAGGSGGGGESMVGTPVVTGTQAIPKGTEIPLAMLMTVVPSGYTPVRLVVEDLNEGTLIIGGGGASLFSTGFFLDISFTSSTQAAALTALWMNDLTVNWTRRTLNLSTTSLLMTTTQSPSTTIAYTIYLKKS